MKLSKELTEMVRRKDEPEECRQKFDQLYGKKYPFILVRYFRVFLNYVLKRAHVDLIELLLSDPRCDLETPLFDLRYPIFAAVESSDVQVMDVFLRESPPVDVMKQYRRSFITLEHNCILYWQIESALQYACCFELEMLGKLLTYDMEQNRDRASSPQLARSWPPLHSVLVHLGRTNHQTDEKFNLYKIIKYMIDLGVDVNEVNATGTSSLEIFIEHIQFVTLQGIDCVDDLRMITDTAQLLLTTQARPDPKKITDMIISLFGFAHWIVLCLHDKPNFRPTNFRHGFALISQLIQMLLGYNAEMKCDVENYPIHVWLIRLCGWLAEARDIRNDDEIVDEDVIYDESMDILSDIFRFLLFNSPEPCTFPICDAKFFDDFISLAGYSSEPGRSSRMMLLVLTSMTINELRQCSVKLTALRNNMAITDSSYDSTTQALLWVQKTLDVPGTSPFSLKHLARHVILRSIPYRTLSADPSALGLPPCLRTYILSYNAGFEY